MNGTVATSMQWICREDLETELQVGIANHAQVLESALADPEFPYDQQATPEVMVLGGVSGIGKVRLKSTQPTSLSIANIIEMLFLFLLLEHTLTILNNDRCSLEPCMRFALVGRCLSNKLAQTLRSKSSTDSRMQLSWL